MNTAANPHRAGSIIRRLRAVVKRGDTPGAKRIHIVAWTREHDGNRDYPRPIYALGDGPDAPRPKPKCMKLVKREYWARRRQRIEMFGPGADLQMAWQTLSGCAVGVESGA